MSRLRFYNSFIIFSEYDFHIVSFVSWKHAKLEKAEFEEKKLIYSNMPFVMKTIG